MPEKKNPRGDTDGDLLVREIVSAQLEAVPPSLLATLAVLMVTLAIAPYRLDAGVLGASSALVLTVLLRAAIWFRVHRHIRQEPTSASSPICLKLMRLQSFLGGLGWAMFLAYLHRPGRADPLTLVLAAAALTIGGIAGKGTDRWSVRLFTLPYLLAAGAVSALTSESAAIGTAYALMAVFAHLSSDRYERWFKEKVESLRTSQHRLRQLRRTLSRQRLLRRQLKRHSERLRTILKTLQLGFWELDVQKSRLRFDGNWWRLTSAGDKQRKCSLQRPQTASVEEALNFLYPDDRNAWLQMIDELCAAPQRSARVDVRPRILDGDRTEWVTDLGRVLKVDRTGMPTRIVGLRIEATERIETRLRAQSLFKRLKNLTDQLPGFVFEWVEYADGSTAFPFASAGIERLYGLRPNEAQEHPELVYSRIHPEDRSRVAAAMRKPAARGESRIVEYRVASATSEYRWMRMEAQPEKPEPGVTYWYGFVSDIHAQKLQEQELWLREHTDWLTGLGNRRALIEELNKKIGADQRPDTFGVVLINIWQFRSINDILGPTLGDEVLRSVSRRLLYAAREDGHSMRGTPPSTVYRLDADEFALLYEDRLNAVELHRYATRLTAVVSGAYTVGGQSVKVSAYAGAASYSPTCRNPTALLQNADTALRSARRGARTTARVYDTALDAANRRLRLIERELAAAIERQQLSLVYQPVHNLRTRRAHGVEALLRWMHPELGPVSPAEFVPIAEENGQIIPIGDWVISEAVRQYAEWHQNDPDHCPVWVTVNLSRQQLARPRKLVATLAKASRENALPAGTVILEITERDAVLSPERTRRTLKRLRRMGFPIAIDDFGTGMSSLSCLQDLPVDIVKIDKSFVDTVDALQNQGAVIKAILALCDALHLRCVAEGIENPIQAETLLDLGCQFGQGYHFSRPLAPSAIPAYFGAHVNTASSAVETRKAIA